MRLLIVVTFIATPSLMHAQFFTRVTDSPLSTTPGDSRSVNWVDVNGDGYPDCFISNGPQAGQNNSLYLNDTKGNFTRVTDDPIVSDGMPSDGATFADVDNDGDLDAFVVNWYNRHNLAYINSGNGTFTKVQEGIWVSNSGYSETAAFGDFNNDGLVDLYVTNSAGISKNFLYRNQGNQVLEKVAEGSPVTDISASRNVSWTDIDNDGDVDLFITNENAEADQCYRNDGNGLFEKRSDLAITTDHLNTMSSSWADIDNDGDLDLFLATDGSKNQLYRNEGNFVFTKILTTDISANSTKSFSSAWSDIDNDGDLDLFVTNAFQTGIRLKNNFYLNDGTGHFTAVTDDVVVMDEGWSYGCAFGDYDNDGFQDLAVATTRFGNTDEPDYLYHNNGNDNHWIMLALEGRTSNRSAIGTKVRVKTILNGIPTWQLREVSAQSAYCSQNDMRVHFGLADSEMVDSIVIEWPSGTVQYLTGVASDQLLDIEEDLVNSVSAAIASFGLKVFPNPTNGDLCLEANFVENNNELSLEIFGDTGEIAYKKEFHHKEGLWQYHIDLRQLQLSPGLYVVRVVSGISAEERKIILIR